MGRNTWTGKLHRMAQEHESDKSTSLTPENMTHLPLSGAIEVRVDGPYGKPFDESYGKPVTT